TMSRQASTSRSDLFNGNVDYNWSDRDRTAIKYYYQDAPGKNPYASAPVNGFPKTLKSGAQVLSIDNTTILGPTLTWETKAGVIRQRSFASTAQPFTPADAGINLFGLKTFPSVTLGTVDVALNRSLSFGPSGNFANTGMFQNRLDLSSSVNWIVGRHTIYFGGNI